MILSIRTFTIPFCILYNILELTYASLHCPNDNEYIQRNNYLRCKKIFNCLPGKEIIDCEHNCEPLKCVPCRSGYVQPDLIHWDSDNISCYKAPEDNSCYEVDVKPKSRNTNNDATFCPKAISCQCDNSNCFYGKDPCVCNRQFNICGKNETMNPETGICEPCPPGHFKESEGCGECFRIPFIHSTTKSPTPSKLTTTHIPVVPIQETRNPTTEMSVTTFSSYNPVTIKNTTIRYMQTNTMGILAERGQNLNVFLGVAVLAALVTLAVGVTFYIYRKRNPYNVNTDEERIYLGNGWENEDRPQETIPLQCGDVTENECKINISNASEGENRLINENNDNENVDESAIGSCGGDNCNNKDVNTTLADILAKKQSLDNNSVDPMTDTGTLETDGPSHMDHAKQSSSSKTEKRNLSSSPTVTADKSSRSQLSLGNTFNSGGPISPESEKPGVHPWQLASSSTKTESLTEKKNPVAYPSDESNISGQGDNSQPNSIDSFHKTDKAYYSHKTESLPSSHVSYSEGEMRPQTENEEETERKSIVTKSFEDSGFHTTKS